jgi:hypothetical protein
VHFDQRGAHFQKAYLAPIAQKSPDRHQLSYCLTHCAGVCSQITGNAPQADRIAPTRYSAGWQLIRQLIEGSDLHPPKLESFPHAARQFHHFGTHPSPLSAALRKMPSSSVVRVKVSGCRRVFLAPVGV